ncbi:hypothetical protein M432DRAFT_635581 [Thermoascus aurantiacus ATCC 26904]
MDIIYQVPTVIIRALKALVRRFYGDAGKMIESETSLDMNVRKGRVFKIINENVKNPVTGGQVGYKLILTRRLFWCTPHPTTSSTPNSASTPVMPAEKMLVSLKPVGFFDKNPAINVPIGTREDN